MAKARRTGAGSSSPGSPTGLSPTRSVRCAVYTRKSSDEGLDQAFNSLHAQRDACEAYVRSQKGEGWTLVPTAYDDGAYSGGTMARPALTRLLADVAAGLVDIVLVYKVDRLSRALGQFARMVDLFDAHGCSFVSVTQAFNTTSSMGRLTLNMLLSFAQFEREVTGERIRDKIAASKARGMWMGGVVPLGYQPHARTLVVVDAEAAQVRTLFDLYLTHRSVDAVVTAAEARGIRARPRAAADGTTPARGRPLGRGALYRILANRLYVGEIAHKGVVHPGLHEAIVPRATFDAAQALLDRQRRRRQGPANHRSAAFLAGLLVDADGTRLTPTHTQKRGKRYRYYAGGRLRLPAAEIEALVSDTLAGQLASPASLLALLPDPALASSALLAKAAGLAARLQRPGTAASLVPELVERVAVTDAGISVGLRLGPLGLAGLVAEIAVPATVGRDRRGLALVMPGSHAPAPDPALIALVAQARSWFEQLTGSPPRPLARIAAAEQVSASYVRQLLPAAFLAPDLVARLVEGRQPPALTAARLKQLLPLPHGWDEQRKLFDAM